MKVQDTLSRVHENHSQADGQALEIFPFSSPKKLCRLIYKSISKQSSNNNQQKTHPRVVIAVGGPANHVGSRR